jgi:HEAT repeat protein
MHYLSTWNDLTTITQPILTSTDDLLYRRLMMVCRWLRDTSKSARWRTFAMRHLAVLITKDALSLGVRARALSALTLSGDPGVPVLLRSLLSNQADNVRLLGALGCGLVNDTKSVQELIHLLEDPALTVKTAAMLALAAIGSRDALDAIAHSLLHGTEEIRRVSAEALANLPEEGHPALSEGAVMPDLLVRRAVVYYMAWRA